MLDLKVKVWDDMEADLLTDSKPKCEQKFIWRVEGDSGFGCYTAHLPFRFIDKHDLYNGHPTPEHDEGIKRNPCPVEICGFMTKEQAKDWFTPYELKMMKTEGHELKKVNVKCITAIGDKQVLAIKKEN